MTRPELLAALRIASREARASKGKFFFVALAVAVGVSAITGVRGFGQAFRGMLLREARTLMAADLSVRTFDWPSPAQFAVMDALGKRGVARAWITETVSMMAGPGTQDPLLVSIKAVDPERYPFYGEVRLEPAGTLKQTLTPDAVAVSDDLLLRLGASVGDSVRLGEASYRIAAVVAMEPDRMTGSLNVGPRVMISRAGMQRSGLLIPGSRAAQRFLFKLGSGAPGIEEARRTLQRAFPAAMIADFRQTHPVITRGLNRATTFLSLVSLVALIVGALGVATAMHSHLRQRMDSIAVMKCLGARSSQVIRIYVLQTLLLGLAGSLAGVVFGLAVQAAFPSLLARYFPVAPNVGLDVLSSLQGLGAGLLTTLLFTWPPLAAIRRIRPSVILRRDMLEARPSWAERRRNYRSAAAGGAVILAGLALLAASLAGDHLSDSLRAGGWFAAGLLVSLLVLVAFAKGLLWALALLVRRLGRRISPGVRHGIANLYRPGNQAPFVIAALGVGVMFTLTIFLIQRSILAQMFRSAPPGMPNVFLVNVTERERAGLLELLSRQPGVERPPVIIAAVSATLESIDGQSIRSRTQGRARHYHRPHSITWAAEKPEGTEVVAGAWWTSKPAAPEVSVAEDAAGTLSITPGAKLEFSSYGRRIFATVASIHRTESIRPGATVDFILSPGALDGLPTTYYGGMRVRARDVAALQRAAWRSYPTVTVVNVADVLNIVQDVIDRIAIVVRFVSFFAILAGAVVLASSVAGTRLRRIREMAVLKALGASRRRLTAIYSIELLVLGGTAGVMASLLATGFTALLLNRLFEGEFRLDPLPNLLAILLSALLAVAAGWVAGYRHLGRKPLEVLRGE